MGRSNGQFKLQTSMNNERFTSWNCKTNRKEAQPNKGYAMFVHVCMYLHPSPAAYAIDFQSFSFKHVFDLLAKEEYKQKFRPCIYDLSSSLVVWNVLTGHQYAPAMALFELSTTLSPRLLTSCRITCRSNTTFFLVAVGIAAIFCVSVPSPLFGLGLFKFIFSSEFSESVQSLDSSFSFKYRRITVIETSSNVLKAITGIMSSASCTWLPVLRYDERGSTPLDGPGPSRFMHVCLAMGSGFGPYSLSTLQVESQAI